MIDSYSLVLWAAPNKDDIDTQANQILSILTILSKVDALKPKYLTATRKQDAIEFDLTLESVKDVILKNQDQQFAELGSNFSFFTSKIEDESIGISISTGISDPHFFNTLVVNLHTDLRKEPVVEYNELADIFKELVQVMQPFYGCVTCKSVRNMFNGYYDNVKHVPNSVFDLNYWGDEITKKLTLSGLTISKVYDIEKIGAGHYMRLQQELIDPTQEQDIELVKEVNSSIGI